MIGIGPDALYKPKIVSERYESCIICSEKIGINSFLSKIKREREEKRWIF